jgi:hypothetical protein
MLPETGLVWTVWRAIWGDLQCAAPSAALTTAKGASFARNAPLHSRAYAHNAELQMNLGRTSAAIAGACSQPMESTSIHETSLPTW